MKNVLLIINPVSGQQKIQPNLFGIVNELCKADCNVQVVTTQYREHATAFASTAKDNNFDTIICAGGDGTLNETITGIIKSNSQNDIKLGYIPCGSTNDFADTLGIKSDPIECIKDILHSHETKLDIGNFNDSRFFSYIASFGALTDASYSAPQDLKNMLGHFAYIIEGLKDVTNIKPIPATIIADGKTYSGKYIFGSVSNTKSVGGLVKLKDEIVDLHDGYFELLLVKYPNDLMDFNEIILGSSSSDFSSYMFDFIKAKEITFKFEEAIPWSLDGEKEEGKNEVIINVLNQSISFIS